MDLNKASYATVIQFGDMTQFQMKLKKSKDTVKSIVNYIENSRSLLETSLFSRKFDIANYLLDNGANVNVVSREGYNEFHFLAANINETGAIAIARRLLNMGCSVMQKDNKLRNTAFFTLCMEAFKKRIPEVINFLIECFENVTDIDEKNCANLSIRNLLVERGSEELKEAMRLKWDD